MKPIFDIPLWADGKIPFARPEDSKLNEHVLDSEDGIERVTDVTVPTLSFYRATGKTPRPVVLICPGGGYSILAWNHEGTDIAAWLNSNGISAALLKYRCPGRREAAFADAARAMRIVRSKASEWNIDPFKAGIIGFSAGAHLAGRVCNPAPGQEPYERADSADEFDFRPDYSFIIYPAYYDRENLGLDPDMHVSSKTPPAFIMQAEDDTSLVDSSIAYFMALKRERIPSELHMFSHGGHGYGMFKNGNPTAVWPELAMKWFAGDIMKSPVW